MANPDITAVLFDFGGVVLTSPFDAFAAHERDVGLPEGFIRQLNATNPHDNAWAKLERADVDLAGFVELFEAEATAAGGHVDARVVLQLLHGEVRPQMVEALRRIKAAAYPLALLTNNIANDEGPGPHPDVAEALALFDVVIESSKAGVRKPDPKAYELVLEALGVRAEQLVFLDDLGINLKPARAMGMTTIKVVDPDDALADLEQVLGIPLR